MMSSTVCDVSLYKQCVFPSQVFFVDVMAFLVGKFFAQVNTERRKKRKNETCNSVFISYLPAVVRLG